MRLDPPVPDPAGTVESLKNGVQRARHQSSLRLGHCRFGQPFHGLNHTTLNRLVWDERYRHGKDYCTVYRYRYVLLTNGMEFDFFQPSVPYY